MDLSGKLAKILIIESDGGMQNLIRIYLKKIGALPKVIETWDANAKEDVRLGQFDLAIIDWKTKIHPAMELYRLLRAPHHSTKIPILFISGQVTRDDILKTSNDPLTKFVVKPFSEDLLFKALRELTKRSMDAKFEKTPQIRIHKGEKRSGTANPIVLEGQAKARGGLDLFQGEGLQTPGNSRPSARQSDLLSDIDIEDDDSLGNPNESPTSNQHYPIGQKADASSFDYRLMQQKSQSEKARPSNAIDVLVVDDDEALTTLVQNHLSSVKADHVEVHSNSDDAWSSILRYNYQLIVMNWRCKGMSGLCLYNRIRSRPETAKTPVLILTGGIERDSFRIIENKKLTQVLEKPFELTVFERAVDSIRRLEASDLKLVELSVQTIDACKGDRKRILSQIISVGAKCPSKFEFYLASGQYLIHQGEFLLALKVLEGAAKLEPENVAVMTELAKAYLRLNRPTDSLKLLTVANQFSPGNIQRLCLMGEAGLDLFDTDKARSYFNDALKIDDQNQLARRGATLSENLANFSALRGQKSLKDQFASTLNLIGITLIKNGQVERGIEQYHCAMAFIHEGPTLAKLQFNLALAYHRLGQLSKAIEWLEEALRNTNNNFPKVSQWIERIRAEESERSKGHPADGSTLDWESPDMLDSLANSLQQIFEDDESA